MRTFLALILISLFLAVPINVQASETPNQTEEPDTPNANMIVDEQVEKLEINDIKNYWDEVMTEYGGFLPESQKGSLLQFLSGEKELSFQEWMKAFLKFLFHELLANGKLLGTLILLTVFSMLLQLLQNAFNQSAVSKVAYALVYMVLIIIALNSFHVAIQYTNNAIHSMTNFILALIPLLLALMASSGGLASAAFFHPVIIFLMNTSGLLIQNCITVTVSLGLIEYR
jgi:stage III sporulation protein AE